MERIAAKLLHNPVKLNVGKSGVLVANEKIAQEVIVLAEHDKQSRLVEILVSLPLKHAPSLPSPIDTEAAPLSRSVPFTT